MKLGTRRVHACQTCRKRKIKCDNRLPDCTQCTRLGKKCPGSTEGLIFIHSGNASQRHQQLDFQDEKATSPSSSRMRRMRIWDSEMLQGPIPDMLPDIGGGAHEVISRLAVEIGSHHLSPWTPHPWFLTIPQLALSPDVHSTMLLPLHAITVAFRALAQRDAKLRAEAYQYYSRGLERHQAQLHQFAIGQRRQRFPYILNALVMSMALLEFEMMAPLATDSWFPYAYGALSLLEQVTPEGCQESPFYEIFWQLRFFMSYVALSTRKTTFLGSQPWKEIPFRYRGKPDFDCVIDTLLLNSAQHTTEDLLDIEPIERQTLDERSPHGQGGFNSSRQSQLVDNERMIRLLTNVGELVSTCTLNATSKRQESLSMAILSDSKHLMNQPFLPFNVGLQVTAAANLVAQYASSSVQKQEAAMLYADWRGQFALTC
ncbi:hypothetical protein V8C26DRAFT_77947 [Trichoderma gracile]